MSRPLYRDSLDDKEIEVAARALEQVKGFLVNRARKPSEINDCRYILGFISKVLGTEFDRRLDALLTRKQDNCKEQPSCYI